MQFIVEIIVLIVIYLLHLFCKIRANKVGLQAKCKFIKNKKISKETQEYLDFVLLGSWGRKFILDRYLKLFYYGESVVTDLDRKQQSMNDVLEEMGRYEYKIRKEIHERCFSEDEIMGETLKDFDKNMDFVISFDELIRCVFNDKFEKACLVVECNMEIGEKQFIYILRQNGKAFFRFISNDFARLMNKKNGIIQSYSKAISFVSHEFRTPLNCIINMLQAMQHTVENEIINNFIVPSLISSKFLLNLVSDLLDIAQLEAEKFKLIFLDFNLSALLEDTLQIISFQAVNRKIHLELKIDETIMMAKSDPNRIRQIITNLLSILFNLLAYLVNYPYSGNALKYSSFGGVITLSAYRCQQNEIELSVKDTGLGIQQDNLSKLFKEFSKINDKQNLALNSQGIGLGLVISNKIAHQLNEIDGGIKVESELGKGSTFSFKMIDHLIEEKECLMTASHHAIEKIFKIECRLINSTVPIIENESVMLPFLHKNSSSSIIDIPTILEKKNHRKLSGSFDNPSSKRIFLASSFEKSIKSISSKYLTKGHFFFAEAATFKNFTSLEDFKSKECFIERKKEFITHYMHLRCSCPYILAVDDNDFNNLAMNMHAKRLEIPIITALSGYEALKMIQEQEENSCCNHFKLIFMDIEMPMMDGLEAFQIIKTLYEQKKRKLCIVGVTGHAEGSDKLEEVKEIMGDVLVKPISFESLVIFLEKYMKEINE